MCAARRYSQHARRAVRRARAMAREQGSGYVDAAHVLVAIAQEPSCLGGSILRELALNERLLQATWQPAIRLDQSAMPLNSPVVSPSLREGLKLAADESRWLGQAYVGTEHLLLGITRGSDDALLTLLSTADINPEQIRKRVRQVLQDGTSEISLEHTRRLSRLSELSRRVIHGTEQLAGKLGHDRVGLAHLLLVMAFERRSICARLLSRCGLEVTRLEADLARPRTVIAGMIEELIDRAVERAESLGSHYTGSDHLLLALAEDSRGIRLLRKYSADPQAITVQLLAYLTR